MQPNEMRPTVWWSIPCLDSRRIDPLPLPNRHFVLDWAKLNSEQVADVMSILRVEDAKHQPSGLESTIISIRRSRPTPDNRMLAYREFFVEVLIDEMEETTARVTSMVSVCLNREYFEDENGQEITHYELMQRITGNQEPIIAGDAECILRLGASLPKNEFAWTEERANTIAQFLDVVQRICSSEWYRHPQVLTFEVQNGGDSSKFPDQSESELLEAVFPNDSKTLEVLAYFRQLHAKDRLLERACEVFIETCSDQRKNVWLEDLVVSFKQMIDTQPVPFNVPFSRRKIIQIFMYGAGLLHSKSVGGDEQLLANLIQSQGKHRVVTIFN